MRAREAAKASRPTVVLLHDADREWDVNMWGVALGQRGLPWAEYKEFGDGMESTYLDRVRTDETEQQTPDAARGADCCEH
eukprot:6263916-Lingulodinium_polyedra.AAC.1